MFLENENELPFKDLPPNQMKIVVNALESMGSIPLLFRVDQKIGPDSWLHERLDQTLIYINKVYKVPKVTVKDSINWDEVHKKYNYLVRDQSGNSWLYGQEPYISNNVWYRKVIDRISPVPAEMFSSLCKGNAHHTESVIKRP